MANFLSTALANFKTGLSRSGTFQSWVGVGTPTLALPRIHLDHVLPLPVGDQYTLAELNSLRPFALCSLSANEPSSGLAYASLGDGRAFRRSFTVECIFEQDTSAAGLANPVVAELEWRDKIGDILEDLEAESAKAGNFTFTNWTIATWGRVHDDDVTDEGDYQQASVVFRSEAQQ